MLTFVILKCIRCSYWSQDGLQKKRGPIRDRVRRYFSTPIRLNFLWVISNFLYNGYMELFPPSKVNFRQFQIKKEWSCTSFSTYDFVACKVATQSLLNLGQTEINCVFMTIQFLLIFVQPLSFQGFFSKIFAER